MHTLSVKAALLFVLAFAANLAGAQDKKAIDAFVTSLMQKRGVPGVSIAIVREGKVIYAKGYGLSDIENDVPAKPETVYQIGSMTKQFTAAIVMQLVDEGKVKIDEPARTYLTDLPEAWKAVTVRQLLNHTSGIRSYTDIPTFGSKMREPVGSGFLAYIQNEKPDFAPGEKWHYNNSGYFLLGMLIEKVTGNKYRDELQKRILKPLGMSSTQFNDWGAVIKNRARGYDPGKSPRNAQYIDYGWPGAAGAIVSTVLDLAKWDAALYRDAPVRQSLLKESWTPVKLNGGGTYDYGFGWFLGKLGDTPIVEHGGDIPGFNSDILRVPSKQVSIIVLCNADPGIATPVAHGLAALVDPTLKAEAKGIEDKDPRITAAHKALLAAFANGTVKEDGFTDEMRKKLFPNLAVTVKQFLGEMGSIERFVLMSDTARDGTRARAYRATIGGQDLNMIVVTNKNGKIAGFSLTPR